MSVKFTVPLTPPSVNSYVRHTRGGIHYKSKEAIAFAQAVHIFARGQHCDAKEYQVTVTIYLGKGQKLDIDNGMKCTLDSLCSASVIRSDAAIRKLTIEKHRDALDPRTEVSIEAYAE